MSHNLHCLFWFCSNLMIYRWLLPKETGYPFAAGNQATCIAQGYLGVFFLVATIAFRCVLAFTCEFKCVNHFPFLSSSAYYTSFFVFCFDFELNLKEYIYTHFHFHIRYLLLDWLTVCRGKQISELRGRYWTFFFYGLSWAFGLGQVALSWTTVIPQESGGWAYCVAVYGREPHKVDQSVGNSWSILWNRLRDIVVFLHDQFSTIYSPYREANG